MRPDDNLPIRSNPRPTTQVAPVNDRQTASSDEAATNIIRNQIDSIYGGDDNLNHDVPTQVDPDKEPKPDNIQLPKISKFSKQPTVTTDTNSVSAGPGAVNMQAYNQQKTPDNPYQRTHEKQKQAIQGDDWKKYHSAWQSYYQQYYERYYVGQVNKARQSLEVESKVPVSGPETFSNNEAMYDLREKLRSQITTKAQKVRKSRHFIPIISAVCVVLIFMFLQYNRVIFAAVNAYVTPGSLDPATLIVDPGAGAAVSADPKLIIPKISVNVPIVWDANASSEASLNSAMDNGVAWFNIQGASARPGELGNFAVSGHSSNDWLDQGDYKFIFARLEQMSVGDTIYVDYNSTRYIYSVTDTKVVKPTDVTALHVGTDKPRITLITCTPLGTALNRLLVFADQISPDPDTATPETTSHAQSEPAQMPANSPTFLQRLFGL